jgi:hypothetical protein
LSELGEQSQLWVENLPSVYCSCLQGHMSAPLKPQVKTVSEFVKDVKYLLGKFSVSLTLGVILL